MDQVLARIVADSARRVIASQYPGEVAEFEVVLPALLLALQLDTTPKVQAGPLQGLALDATVARDHSALAVFVVAELAQAALQPDDPECLDRVARALTQSISDRALVECAKTAVRAATTGSGE